MYTRIKTDKEIDAIRESGAILASVLDLIENKLEPGMTGVDIDNMAKKEAKSLGGETPFLGYGSPPFPGSICVSVNDVVEHGIPDSQVINDGDIVSVDFGIKYKGMITDSGRTLMVGDVAGKTRKLVETTEKSLYAGIDKVRHGAKVGDISNAVETVLKKQKLGIIRELVGHGVGHDLHEEPDIPNYGTAGKGPMLYAGMTIAIEPMASLGDWRISLDKDGWTIRMADGSLSAHFEHTILVTDTGSEILTSSKL